MAGGTKRRGLIVDDARTTAQDDIGKGLRFDFTHLPAQFVFFQKRQRQQSAQRSLEDPIELVRPGLSQVLRHEMRLMPRRTTDGRKHFKFVILMGSPIDDEVVFVIRQHAPT